MMPYEPCRVSEIASGMIPVGLKVRVYGIADGDVLKDPLSDAYVRLVGFRGRGETVEVFGTLLSDGIHVDFAIPSKTSDPAGLKRLIEEEREKVLWINKVLVR